MRRAGTRRRFENGRERRHERIRSGRLTMSSPESYDELITRIEKEYDQIREEEKARAHIRLNQPIRTGTRKVSPPGRPSYLGPPPAPELPYVVRDLFTDEEVARFRYASDAEGFAKDDLTMYTVDTTPQGEGETND